MKWFRIPKDVATPSHQSEYTGWKQELRVEGRHQCVYCAMHESAFGGLRNYAVEHYRPKSRFPQFELTYSNLFYICSVCNSFKGDDWPTDNPVPTVAGYLDPSTHDYSEHVLVVRTTGVARGRNAAARYKVHRLHLNRNQLILYRRSRILLERAQRFMEFAEHAKTKISRAALQKLLSVVMRIEAAERALIQAVPYEPADTRH